MSDPREQVQESDYLLIEKVLYGLWAPNDRDRQDPAEVLNDMGAPQLSIDDVVRARCALERLRSTMPLPNHLESR